MVPMKMKSTLFLIILFISSVALQAQVSGEDVLMTIAGKKVTVSEFMAIYQKNNPKGTAIDKKSLEEYLDLYINFKLKVKQAEDLGMDTVAAFKSELKGYRDQLAKPYLIDETEVDFLVQEAFERKHYDVRVSHIFIKLDKDPSPADTLEAYKKISRIMERVKNGEDFGKLAAELSEDPSARDREANQQHPFIKGNNGDLGYFTVFDFIYPFECASYKTEKGKVSPITRTEYGYHIIKVTDKRKAMGTVTVAHIFMPVPKDANHQDSMKVEQRMDTVYQKLMMGAKWDSMVKQYSEDKGSAMKGGILPKFGVNKLVPEFIEVVYNLNEKGDFSKPFMTPYGWHIVKLVDRQLPGTFDEEKADLKKKVMSDPRYDLAKNAMYTKIKKENGFVDYPETKKAFYTAVTDSIFVAKWTIESASSLNKVMMKIGTTEYTQQDFAKFLVKNQRKREKMSIENYVNAQYISFTNDNLMKYQDAHLEDKYPDFRNLMTEYRDGILLFNLTDEKVWSRAVKDTTGLKDFYERNKMNYMWGQRVDASIYTLKNPKLSQKLRNFISSGLSDQDLLKEFNSDTLKVLAVESGKYSKNDNKYIDMVQWSVGLSGDLKADSTSKSIVIVNVKQMIKPEPKSLSEARGLITADYQNYLEKIWIQYLRQKYPVVINKEVLAKIK